MLPSAFVFLALAFNCLGAGSYLYRSARREIQPLLGFSMAAVVTLRRHRAAADRRP
ncbi:hypothetical protein [Actinoplanes siamensis]|uniref:Uncharacterized protein n=1 Tax=Actinoplanes siamensis TaxID=1223317 RepID=A0A919NBS4_9ACTN|nr:hypothetical protein [Actinoplanes siamensis]GIF08269.1 hypothetical protein Asi03nite_58070 [Actinoplanes siamensis]